ncbi:cytochrome P450 9e2-like [Leptidea sinapis]|uniref:cytochrome P450 9e2-like n=1 Tax=Leptidea sinapis TaxID=189913 RepID=UPI0021C4B9E4|nr:cytochrome P450 9e2-like [Leptidea sinapis]
MELTETKQLAQFVFGDWKLLLCVPILFALYLHYSSNFDFFKKKGIKFMKPKLIVGNIGDFMLARTSYHDFQLEIYNNFKGHPYGGIFEGRRPVLYLIDPDIIKAVTIRDFDYFTDRFAVISNAPRYINRLLLNLKGTEWKSVRSIITPSFSSSKVKHMLPVIQSCSDLMVQFLKQYDNKDIEMQNKMGHFTLEVISTCAFGIKSDALTDENAKFVKVAERYDYITAHKKYFLFFVMMFVPKMITYLNISTFNHEATKKVVEMLQATKAKRRSTIRKNDFLQLMIDAAKKEKEKCKNSKEKPLWDDDTIYAQSLLFLIASYETSSTLLSFAIHTLAVQPEIQEKLRKHIVEVSAGKEMSYELLSQLYYLEAFLLETLRLYPPIGRIDRVATKPYTLPDTSIKIDVGDIVAIPVYGIHMDPDYYPEPGAFKPERFIKNGKVQRPSQLFLAFGAGPRNCIGLRFAMFSAKLGMVSLLKNFKFTSCAKTEHPIQFHKSHVLLKANIGLWVHVKKI